MTALLRAILGLCGIAIMALGLNIGLGGIATLGWQGPTDFFTVTDAQAFTVQDNHVRFIAGVWFGVGALFLAGAVALDALRPVLLACILMIFTGALARLSVADPGLLTSAEILPSLIAELVVFPAIAYWIVRDGRKPSA